MCWVGGWDFIGMAVATWWHVIRVRCTCVCGSNNSTGISGAAVYFVWFNVFSWSLYGVGTLLKCWFFSWNVFLWTCKVWPMYRLVLYVLTDWNLVVQFFTGHYGQIGWRNSPLKASFREALALRNFRYPPTQSLVDWWVNPAGVQRTTFADFTQLGLFRCWGAPTFWCRVSNSAPTIPPKLRGRTAQEFTTALTKKVARVVVRFSFLELQLWSSHVQWWHRFGHCSFVSSPISRVKHVVRYLGLFLFKRSCVSLPYLTHSIV